MLPHVYPDTAIILITIYIVNLIFFFQPLGKGKYVFDIGCEQHGEYIGIEQVKLWHTFYAAGFWHWNMFNLFGKKSLKIFKATLHLKHRYLKPASRKVSLKTVDYLNSFYYVIRAFIDKIENFVPNTFE